MFKKTTIHIKLIGFIILVLVLITVQFNDIRNVKLLNSLHNEFMLTDDFKSHNCQKFISANTTDRLEKEQLIEYLALYFLEPSYFVTYKIQKSINAEELKDRLVFWNQSENWEGYYNTLRSIWFDIKYFPVPLSINSNTNNITFDDSWGVKRTYGGNRTHEGTDLFPTQNIPGYYPVLSITDGIVTNIGWLEKGGYRIGITSPSGGYFYYAHLDSYANIQKNDRVQAGQLLGYMGSSGYGPEGTSDQFPVHLHVGIYIHVNQKEVAINPYWILKYLEPYKLKYCY